MRAAASIHIGNSIQQSLNSFFGYLPNVLGFLVILVVGFIVARIIRKVLDKVLEKSKIDEHLTNSKGDEYVEKVSRTWLPHSAPRLSRLLGASTIWQGW